MSESSHDSERSCICVLEVSKNLSLSTILIFDFGFVPTAVFFAFHFILHVVVQFSFLLVTWAVLRPV